MSEGAAPVRHRRRKEARPQELTAAALALFVEKGFAATRLDDIAARAGVSKGTLYLYFDSKEALFRAVIQEGIVPVIEEGEALLAEHVGDSVELLRCLLYGWWELIGTMPFGGIPKLMMSESRNFPEVAAFYHDAVIERGLALIRTAVARGVADGTFRPVDLDAVAPVLIAPIIHLALWRHSFGVCCSQAVSVERYLDTYFDLTMNGLGLIAAGSEKQT
ncbi:MAG: TetR/AcrR family transcriptional regulator [Rhodocyclaceae bacterium]